MLEDMAAVGDESIVSWQPHGKAFRVHQPKVFARTLMPRYFKQTKYKSFQRQLHVYNFHRISQGVDTGAYFHSMFVRNKKSMSLLMSCRKIKGKKSSKKNAVNHDHAAGDPDFYSSETNVDNNLTNALKSDPIHVHAACTTAASTKEKKMGRNSKRGPATAFSAGSTSDHRHPDEEKPLLNSALLFNQDVTGVDPSPSHQLSIADWMDQAQTFFSRDKEGQQACSASEKAHDVSALLREVNHDHHQKHGDEGFFAGKRFFDVETKNNMPLIEVFSAVASNRGGTMLPMCYMPRTA
jgi:hypothetical protein